MPSHADRVRRNYACPTCDGTGRDGDPYDMGADASCDACAGSGILLTAQLPMPHLTGLGLGFNVPDWMIREEIALVELMLKSVRHINRNYDELWP